MDINLRISTAPMLGSNISAENAGLNSEPASSSTLQSDKPAQNNGLSQLNISSNPSSSQNSSSLVNQNTNSGTSYINIIPSLNAAPKDNWAQALATELKTLFESFLSTITKLLEGVFGTKPTSNTSQSTPISASSASNTPVATSHNTATQTTQPKKMETFVEHSARNFINDLNGNISEEKMRENVIMYQLYQKDAEAESIFKTKLNTEKSAGKSSDEAIKSALIETEKSNKIERWESDWVYSLSFRAAQIDSDLNNISGNTGISNTTKTSAALHAAEKNLVAIATGSEIPVMRNI